MRAPQAASLQMCVAEFAWLVRNWIRPLGSHRVGASCQLMGSGMAFPWALLSGARLADSELVEDMKLGIELALGGHPPVFCPEARVTSCFPETSHAASSQRTRWEHGHLQMILAEAPRLLMQALVRGDARLLILALDMAVPPLALFFMLIVAVLVPTLFHSLMGLTWVPLELAAMALTMLTIAVFSAWLGWGSRLLPASALFFIPAYVFNKIPMYVKFLTGRQRDWVRTGRK
jgi:cellulose synthase/poly-beta-1,6-N-acetylglucosamine synthase-like glycosyltransferase